MTRWKRFGLVGSRKSRRIGTKHWSGPELTRPKRPKALSKLALNKEITRLKIQVTNAYS